MKKINYLNALLVSIAAALAVILAWLLLSGCAHDGCKAEAMRCRSNSVEQCNADGDWYVVEHCDGIDPVDWNWTCCYLEQQDLYACLPAAECAGNGDAP
jgi:hypothetical protein